tara:strand:+ start:1507 stop:2919 length:1413 start_codon:yes stop_codon:yes gene_type:complete
MNIKYYKWSKKERETFYRSCNKYLELKECQFFQPYFSLYFHLHNTKKSHKTIDIHRRFFIKEILEKSKESYNTSNMKVNCIIEDKKNKYQFTEELFCKCIPLLDPINFMMNSYNNIIHRNPLLPNNYSYNTYTKINDMNNSAYIDNFFSYICSELTINDKNPSFPIYYGSVNGIKKHLKYDITDDYYDFKREKWFYKNLGKSHSIDIYVSSSDEEDIDDSDDEDNDYISLLKNIPCQYFFIQKLEGTLEDFLEGDINTDIILSCIFQISFALTYLQKHYDFTHNDLHINNIMYTKTDKIYFYYKYNNIYYKVPTYGYSFKIIDFGRAIFKYHNKLFFNDTFNKHGEAGGQYTCPINTLLFEEKQTKKIHPNYNFDLCRLAITILDECGYDKTMDYKEKQPFFDFIYNLTVTEKGYSLSEMKDDFNMYIHISKYACNSLPKKIIQNYIFSRYRIKKKFFPKKYFYNLEGGS